MKNIKLTELLTGLNDDEFRKLGEFVKSPFFNKSKQIIQLYGAVKSLKKNRQEINKKVIFGKIYGKQRYNDQKIRSLVSDFVKLIEKFISFSGYQKNILNQYAVQLKEYRLRESSKVFKNVFRNLKIISKNPMGKDECYYFYMYAAENEAVENRFDDNISDFQENINSLNSNIDHFFIKAKLNSFSTMLQRSWFSHEAISNDNFWMFSYILDYIKRNLGHIRAEHPLIYMDYIFIQMSYEQKTLKNYSILKDMILDNIDKLSIEFVREKFLCLQNYLLKKIFEGQDECKNEIMKMKFEFEKKGFFDKLPYISSIPFFNTVFERLLSGKIHEAEQFFLKYQSKVTKKFRSQVIKLSEGLIYYYKKDYGKAKISLNEVGYVNYYYYFRAKATLIQMSYDLKEFESVYYYIDAVKHYIKRNSFLIKTHRHYNGFTSFLKFMDLVMKIRLGKFSKLPDLKNGLDSGIIECKKWLLEKYRELEIEYEQQLQNKNKH